MTLKNMEQVQSYRHHVSVTLVPAALCPLHLREPCALVKLDETRRLSRPLPTRPAWLCPVHNSSALYSDDNV